VPTLRIDPKIEGDQVARLKAIRAKRDAAGTKSSLEELARRAASGENLVPAILTAVESYATVGEISDTLRQQFGEYQESVVL
jgi:methylmalonyl-CoA mutase N-terminal domain/subunit